MVAKIWVNSDLNYSFAPKGDFCGKIDYNLLCLSSKLHRPATLQKILRANR